MQRQRVPGGPLELWASFVKKLGTPRSNVAPSHGRTRLLPASSPATREAAPSCAFRARGSARGSTGRPQGDRPNAAKRPLRIPGEGARQAAGTRPLGRRRGGGRAAAWVPSGARTAASVSRAGPGRHQPPASARARPHLHVDVQEAALGHLEDEAHLRARGDPLEEALLGMRVDADEVARRRGQQGGQEHQQLSERHHGGAGAEARTGTAASGAAVAATATASSRRQLSSARSGGATRGG